MKYQLIFIICIVLRLFFVTADSSYLFKPITIPRRGPKYYTFELKVVDLAPDGVTRPVWTVNGQYPGPLINVRRGDYVRVTVKNNFGDPATIHWHGIYQNKTNWYDGVPGQTQCPIPNRISFDYEFNVSNQAGTYWYHSHFLAQYVDGLIGPLIVHDPDDPYVKTYYKDYVITVGDWYQEASGNLLLKKIKKQIKGPNPPPDNILISGRGGSGDNCENPDEVGRDICHSDATYTVIRGRKYRFRIINTSAYSFINFFIDNHTLEIIEVEGIPVKKSVVKEIPLHAGQRYSVILHANQSIYNYYIHARIICPNEDLEVTGILHYSRARRLNPYPPPAPEKPKCIDVNPDKIRPYYSKNLTKDINERNQFVVNFTIERGHIQANGSAFIPFFTSPTNQRVIEDENNYYPFENPIPVVHNGSVEILILNDNGAAHPFHLHGHHFWVVGAGTVNTTGERADMHGIYDVAAIREGYDLINPPKRDTAVVPPFGYLGIRFEADNPGVWAFHCHIDWHVEEGMMLTIIELANEFKSQTLPDEVKALCVLYDSRNDTSFNSTSL